MKITIEETFINSELNEINKTINNTIKEYIENYGNSYWKRMEYLYHNQFFDKVKNRTKNITNKRGVKRTKVATKGRYEYIDINKFKILTEGKFQKKCYTHLYEM